MKPSSQPKKRFSPLLFWLLDIKEAFLTSCHHLGQKRWLNIMSILAIAVTLALPLLLQLIINNFSVLRTQMDQGDSITLYLEQSQTPDSIFDLVSVLNDEPIVSQVLHLTPQEVLLDFTQHGGDSGLDILPTNPFPHTLIVRTAEGSNPLSMVQLHKKYESHPAVSIASFDAQWLHTLSLWLKLAQNVFFAIGGLLAVGVVLVIQNTTRLSLSHHQRETALLQQLGATDTMIRRPFLFRGIIIGASAATVSLVIVSALTILLKPVINELSDLYNSSQISSLDWQLSGSWILLGSMLGLSGAYIAVRTELKIR